MTCLLDCPKGNRRGVTLVELLIVIGITSLIAAVALPSVKTLLKDRKTNQAAILVRGFIESAKAMAIAKGRDVAVVLERMSDAGDYNFANNTWFSTDARDLHRNTAIRLSLAEVLPPYTGDLDNSTCLIPNIPGAPPSRVDINLIQNPTLVSLFNADVLDKIAFGSRTTTLQINSEASILNNTANDLTATGGPPPWTAWIRFFNGRTANFDLANQAIVPLTFDPTTFRIYCKPRRLYSKPLQLPKGTCIDLGFSGMGIRGFRDLPRAASAPIPQFPLDLPFATQAIDPCGKIVPINGMRPTYIVFDSQGSLSSIYRTDISLDANGNLAIKMKKSIPSKDLYLLIGKTDKVVFPVDGLPVSYTPPASVSNPPPPFPIEPGINRNLFGASNLADSTSYWVKIPATGGQISMAPVLAPSLTPNAQGIVPLTTALAESRGAAQASVDLSAR
jgi:prepilin-type N-terminal cleavage/methylation domain-containing protein